MYILRIRNYKDDLIYHESYLSIIETIIRLTVLNSIHKDIYYKISKKEG